MAWEKKDSTDNYSVQSQVNSEIKSEILERSQLGSCLIRRTKAYSSKPFSSKLPDNQRDVICKVNLESFMLLTFQIQVNTALYGGWGEGG